MERNAVMGMRIQAFDSCVLTMLIKTVNLASS